MSRDNIHNNRSMQKIESADIDILEENINKIGLIFESVYLIISVFFTMWVCWINRKAKRLDCINYIILILIILSMMI
jgi:hypothetical protein